MTDDEVTRKFGHWAPMLRKLMRHAVGADGMICPMSLTPDQIDDIMCANFDLPRGVVEIREYTGPKPGHASDDCHGACGDGAEYSNATPTWTVDWSGSQ